MVELLQLAMRMVRPKRNATSDSPRVTVRRLAFESLELRQMFSTVPMTIVNNTTVNSNGALAYQDNQIHVAIYAQDFSSQTPPYYYFDSSGNEHLTTSLTTGVVPTFLLSALTKTGDHTYVINLPEQLPNNGQYGINSARMYFSMNADLNLTVNSDGVGSVNAPTLGNSFVDFIEFTANAPNNPPGNLNIDTTNVDQFGMPITIRVDSSDLSNSTDTVGTATTRQSVIDQYRAFTNGPNDPYAVCIWPTSDPTYGPYRILNPSGVLADPQPTINLVQVRTTLQAGIGASDTTISAYDSQAFPDPSTNFNILIDQEEMRVTGAAINPVNGNTLWTVVRGQNGTLAVSHQASTFITVPNPAVSATQTTLTAAGSTNFPTSGPFLLRVDAEVMQVTGVNSHNRDGTITWNVLRGQSGTTAVGHDEFAQIYYNSVVNNQLNGYFNEAIDALFTRYHGSLDNLILHSKGDGTDREYEGTVTQDSHSNYVLRFTTSAYSGVNFDVYYPFFTDNVYFWGDYTPDFTPQAAPIWASSANVNSMSPSTMVFACNGAFADAKFRPSLTSDEQKIMADLENQIVSALNRGVALEPSYSSSGANSWQDPSLYYENNTQGQAWNHYAQFLHQSSVSIDGQNYGFAYDDQDGQASDIGVASFDSIAITLGPWATATNPNPNPNPNPATNSVSKKDFLASDLTNVPPVQSSVPTPQLRTFASSNDVSSPADSGVPPMTLSTQSITAETPTVSPFDFYAIAAGFRLASFVMPVASPAAAHSPVVNFVAPTAVSLDVAEIASPSPLAAPASPTPVSPYLFDAFTPGFRLASFANHFVSQPHANDIALLALMANQSDNS